MHRLDAQVACILWLFDLHQLSVDEDRALVGMQATGDAVDDRALPGAVVAEQADHLAAIDGERDVARRPHRTEGLAHAAQLESGERCRNLSLHGFWKNSKVMPSGSRR